MRTNVLNFKSIVPFITFFIKLTLIIIVVPKLDYPVVEKIVNQNS